MLSISAAVLVGVYHKMLLLVVHLTKLTMLC